MLRKFIDWISGFVNPPEDKMQIDEAKRLLITITSRFSIEEQSQIVFKIKEELVNYRKQEVLDTRTHLFRLEENLLLLQNSIEIE